jgi:hypothetical protein
MGLSGSEHDTKAQAAMSSGLLPQQSQACPTTADDEVDDGGRRTMIARIRDLPEARHELL